MLRHGCWRGIEQPPLNEETLLVPSASVIGLTTFTQPRLYYNLAAWAALDALAFWGALVRYYSLRQ